MTPSPSHAILLVNLGSPTAATADAVGEWLTEFLSDPAVVEIPRWLWLPLLKRIIVPRRAPKVAKLYAEIWGDQESPLIATTRRQADALELEMTRRGWPTRASIAMRYGTPGLAEQLATLMTRYPEITVLLLYPQYSKTTSGSCLQLIKSAINQSPSQSKIRVIDSYATESAYIEALALSISDSWQNHGRGDHLLISFHGLPERTIRRGDPYQQQCERTTAALAERLDLRADDYTLCYQSRFGAARWIGPSATRVTADLAASGIERLDVVCPGFPADCLETLEEIRIQLADQFITAGGSRFHYIPALNDAPHWINAMADIISAPQPEQ